MDFFCEFGRAGRLERWQCCSHPSHHTPSSAPTRELGKYPFPALTSVYEYLHHLLLHYNRLSRDMPECAVPSIMHLWRINPDPLPHAHHCPNPYCTYCTFPHHNWRGCNRRKVSAGRIEILRCLLVTPPASCDTTGGLQGSPRGYN